MKIVGRLTSAEVAALATVGVALALLAARGPTMFSSGPLNAQSRRRVALGGVASHAEIGGRCGACHAPAWGGDRMADRCLGCHADVGKQLATAGPLHGQLPHGRECRSCHTEHRGPHAALTSFTGFRHDYTAFPLTGKHGTVDCKSCHTGAAYQATPSACVSCHSGDEQRAHKGRFGQSCSQCHTTSTWKGAVFSHTIFSINHGRRGNTCAACHEDQADFKRYTCYGCHEHTAARERQRHERRGIVDVANCIECHARRSRRRAAAVPGAEPGVAQSWAEVVEAVTPGPCPAGGREPARCLLH